MFKVAFGTDAEQTFTVKVKMSITKDGKQWPTYTLEYPGLDGEQLKMLQEYLQPKIAALLKLAGLKDDDPSTKLAFALDCETLDDVNVANQIGGQIVQALCEYGVIDAERKGLALPKTKAFIEALKTAEI